jgi:polyphosphate kinase 2 (PPK2 family)
MKSNAAVGFKSKPAAKEGGGPAPALETKKDKSEEENFKEMEEEVHRLLESSAEMKVKKNFNEALIKAKDAASKEKKIRQLREQNGSLD